MPLPPPPSSPRGGGAEPWPVWLIAGSCCLALQLLLAAFYAEENWRGAREWAACRRSLEAQGEKLDWQAFIPPPVPDARNFALTPFFTRAFSYRTDPVTGGRTIGPHASLPREFSNVPVDEANIYDFAQRPGWTEATRKEFTNQVRVPGKDGHYPRGPQPTPGRADALLALERYAVTLAELTEAAAARSLTRFPVDWCPEKPWDRPTSHHPLLQKLAVIADLRAAARLAAGQAEGAADDLALALRLCRDIGDASSYAACLTQDTCLRWTLYPVWEGLADRRWSAGQLARLQAELGRFDMPATYLATVRIGRATQVQTLEWAKRRDLETYCGGRPTSPLEQAVFKLSPVGWFDQSKAVAARCQQDYFLQGADSGSHRFFPGRLAAADGAVLALGFAPTELLAKSASTTLGRTGTKMARAQTGLDHAIVACALERFYLDRQAYPARLDELVPAYMARVPNDVIDGAPLRYRQTPDGRYRLYGVGWNGRDDGGQIIAAAPRNSSLSLTQGDWVWQYASQLPPAPLPAAK